MRYCPRCQTTYGDEMQFCLEDGAALLSFSNNSVPPTVAFGAGETETVVRQNQTSPNWGNNQVTRLTKHQPEVKKSNAPLIAGLTALTLCVLLGGAVGGWLLLGGGEQGKVSSNIYNGGNSSNSANVKFPNANAGGKIKSNKTDFGDGFKKGERFMGCFKDTSVFDLDGHLERAENNTPARCVAVCRAKGFKYAGVQYGESCLCGDSYGKYGAADNCDYKCTGDGDQICGGYNANSIYATGITKEGGARWGAINNSAGLNGERLTFYRGTTVEQCQADCDRNPKCQAFTLIRAGFYNPNDPPMCYLMVKATGFAPSPCCISAIKNGDE